MTKEQEKILIEKSIASCEGAYVPYSGFHVGACVLGEDGKFYTGFNVENVSYGATLCAERSAAINMMTNSSSRKILALAVAAGDTCDTMPCGICRQFLCEFMEPDAPVYTVARNGDYMVKTFAEIMPFAFTSFKKD